MKTSILRLILICTIGIAGDGFAQYDKKTQAANYETADGLAKRALIQLQAGNKKFADSLIKSSISIYPVFSVYPYASSLMSMSDTKQGNELIDLLFEKAKS
ncbi:MAG: hypothetical protein EOO89_18095, partial [Pedobacter sp.]